MTSASRWVLLLPALMATTGSLGAQGKHVIVRVRDQRGEPVVHAVLDVPGARARVTDDSGRIALIVDGDSVKIIVRRLGYTPFVGRAGRGANGEIAVTLRALAQTLTAMRVVERRSPTPLEKSGFYDRMQRAQRGTFNADFITPEELDGRPGVRTTDLFQGRRFVSVARTPGRRPLSYLVGRGGCRMTIYLDRMMLAPNDRREGPVPLDDILGPSQIAAIEIYASANQAPAELIPLVGSAQYGSCGIVAIWTGGRR